MKAVGLSAFGALLTMIAFPPFGPGWLVVIGVAVFLVAVRWADSPARGALVGAVYGLGVFGGLMWWLGLLDPLALVLLPVQAAFPAVYGWWLAHHTSSSPVNWMLLASGGWAVMELVRYRFPVGGQEWGAVGYALSDNLVTRAPAAVVGTSGLTVLVVLLAAQTALAFTGRSWRWAVAPLVTASVVLFAVMATYGPAPGPSLDVAIVQGSTPCPFERCPPDERLRTFEQHLSLTATIDPDSVDLVVWPESSSGSTNADPVLNDEIRESIADQARRVGAPILVGTDRTVSDTRFVNANVVFDESGSIVGEYRKQHPVPFGEYIPARPLFDWIPALDQVPRDMVPGDGPVVFDLGAVRLGSVISWEGGFSRYALQHRRAGAEVMVVATNKASYGPDAPTSDQFIGMTRMRAVELGVPVIHAAVTGKSAVIDSQGSFESTTGTGDSVVLYGETGGSMSTVYITLGDALMYLAAAVGVVGWWLSRPLVGSGIPADEEE